MSSRTLHVEVLTEAQARVLHACAGPSARWGAYLAGGAAAALQLGHRRSDDLDWFAPKATPPRDLLADLKSVGGTIEITQNDEGTFNGTVDGVKFSVFRYSYPLIERTLPFDGSQLASLRDLAAMKMAAVISRTTKRDYVDVHALLTTARVSLEAQVAAFHEKFPKGDPTTVAKALGYFKDVDKAPMPVMLNGATWEVVKKDLTRALERFDLTRALKLKSRHRGPDLDR